MKHINYINVCTYKYKVIKLINYYCLLLYFCYCQSMNVGDAIYHTEWPLLSISDKKELLMIMMRSTIPVKFTSSFLITLSLQSFSNVSTIIYLHIYIYNIYTFVYI